MSKLTNVTKDTFESEVLKADKPVVVDFFASWCAPCKAITPFLEKVAETGKVKVVKVNVDEQPELAKEFEVRSIPFLVFANGGKVVGNNMGAVSPLKLDVLLNRHFGVEP